MKDEAALLKAAKKMDQESLVAIFDSYAPAIYRYALRLCQDPIEADNIVGDVFAQLLEKLAAGEGPVINLRSYLYQIAYHLIVNRARHNHRFRSLEAVENPLGKGAAPSPQLEAEERVLMESLIDTMHSELSETQRHVIILRFLEDFSLRETAAVVGKTVNNVKVIQNRGIAKLRKSLGLRAARDRKKPSS